VEGIENSFRTDFPDGKKTRK